LGIALGRFQNLARGNGSIDPISNVVSAAVLAPANWLGNGANSVGETVKSWGRSRQLESQVKALQSEVAGLKLYARENVVLKKDLETLRSQDALPPIENRERIRAKIIAYSPREGRLTLNVGSAQGIRAGAPVIQLDGLLGVISSVSASTCQLNLVTSTQVRIGAMVIKDVPAAGLLRGQGPNSLVLEYLESNSIVDVGDIAYTSGFSEVIPRGIPIGQVVAVEKEADFGMRRARLVPVAQLGATDEVWVVK
jgi:rod shape-determining protein MreC